METSPLLDEYVLAATNVERPRVCFLPTASGDADHYIVRFYRRFAGVAEATHLSLFRRDKTPGAIESDFESHLLTQDLIYVGGGSVLSLLGAWQAHGIDAILRRAWARGVVLCGLSAGSLCWFDEAVTAFHGPPQPVRGLGLLPFSNCVHYDGEPSRREAYKRMVAHGMIAGYGVPDGVALHFSGRELAHVVASKPDRHAYRVEPQGEVQITARYLGEEAALAAA